MKIKKWIPIENQMSRIGKHNWSVARLIELSRGLDVFEAPIDCICVWSSWEKVTMREMVMHMQATQDANLEYPIILDEDGEVMDGRHRLMKAMMLGNKTIKAVRFDENPSPCVVDD
jgi:hypothetical protein